MLGKFSTGASWAERLEYLLLVSGTRRAALLQAVLAYPARRFQGQQAMSLL